MLAKGVALGTVYISGIKIIDFARIKNRNSDTSIKRYFSKTKILKIKKYLSKKKMNVRLIDLSFYGLATVYRLFDARKHF